MRPHPPLFSPVTQLRRQAPPPFLLQPPSHGGLGGAAPGQAGDGHEPAPLPPLPHGVFLAPLGVGGPAQVFGRDPRIPLPKQSPRLSKSSKCWSCLSSLPAGFFFRTAPPADGVVQHLRVGGQPPDGPRPLLRHEVPQRLSSPGPRDRHSCLPTSPPPEKCRCGDWLRFGFGYVYRSYQSMMRILKVGKRNVPFSDGRSVFWLLQERQ